MEHVILCPFCGRMFSRASRARNRAKHIRFWHTPPSMQTHGISSHTVHFFTF